MVYREKKKADQLACITNLAAADSEIWRKPSMGSENTNCEDYRPWGHYQTLADTELFKAKKIVVIPGKRLSLQRHQYRDEHWYIVQGQAEITIGSRELLLGAYGSVDIPRLVFHRVKNVGLDNLIIIEVQTGDYFREEDIERIEDDYGRI